MVSNVGPAGSQPQTVQNTGVPLSGGQEIDRTQITREAVRSSSAAEKGRGDRSHQQPKEDVVVLTVDGQVVTRHERGGVVVSQEPAVLADQTPFPVDVKA